jgi:hypothetical protein
LDKDPNMYMSCPARDPRLANDPDTITKYKSYVWKRASDFFGAKTEVFKGIGPEDIKQGALGDCYYLQSLSSLARYPHLVKRLFRTQTVNAAGIYEVTFVINGVFKSVVIDDFVPFFEKEGYVS